VISPVVLTISAAKKLNPVEKRKEAIKEQTQGPYMSIVFPTRAAKGYWPIIPLRHFRKDTSS